MPIHKGARLPNVPLTRMTESGPDTVDSDSFFRGRKVVLFAVPGAFTPTCSAKHLPGFIAKADAIKDKGVDAVACISVNDAFVMGAWGQAQRASGKVEMLADGNGEFTEAIGLDMDASGFGMGTRSQRYAMIVDNGVVTELFVEKPGEFEVSSAENVLRAL